jgi:hypothetical protein
MSSSSRATSSLVKDPIISRSLNESRARMLGNVQLARSTGAQSRKTSIWGKLIKNNRHEGELLPVLFLGCALSCVR